MNKKTSSKTTALKTYTQKQAFFFSLLFFPALVSRISSSAIQEAWGRSGNRRFPAWMCSCQTIFSPLSAYKTCSKETSQHTEVMKESL